LNINRLIIAKHLPLNDEIQRYHPPPSRNPGSPLALYLKHFFRELTGVWEKLRHVSPGKAVRDTALKTIKKSLKKCLFVI